MKKIKVRVEEEIIIEDGKTITPLVLHWDDGRSWEITRVLHSCRVEEPDFKGLRFTVMINNEERYLYRGGMGQWFVNVKEGDDMSE